MDPNTSIYTCLEKSSTDNVRFIDENEESNENTSFLNKLKAGCVGNNLRLIIDHININSMQNKFGMLSNTIKCSMDILMEQG